jgi:hypothetical protein
VDPPAGKVDHPKTQTEKERKRKQSQSNPERQSNPQAHTIALRNIFKIRTAPLSFLGVGFGSSASGAGAGHALAYVAATQLEGLIPKSRMDELEGSGACWTQAAHTEQSL